MINRDHIVENEEFVGLAGRGVILNFPISSRLEENCYNISPEICRSFYVTKNNLKKRYFSVNSNDYRVKPNFISDIAISVRNIISHNLPDVNTPVSNVSGATLIESASLIYGKAVEYLRNDQFHFPQIVNEFSRDIFKLEVKILSELKALEKEEVKWTSLSDFAEEYKRVFEITDEELWFEFGSELYAIQSEIEAIDLYKRSIYISKSYIERAKRIFYISSRVTRYISRCEIRHHIAFSTKNLDDEHNSGVKTLGRLCYTQSENVLNEKDYYNKTFAFSQ